MRRVVQVRDGLAGAAAHVQETAETIQLERQRYESLCLRARTVKLAIMTSMK